MNINTNLNQADISSFFFKDARLVYLGATDEAMYNMFKKGEYVLEPDSQYIGIEEDGQLIAVVRYEYFTAQCVSMHMFMNSKFHTTTKPTEGVELLKTFITQTLGINKVILMVPSSCIHIHKFAKKHGFVKEGTITSCYKWRQKMVDLVIYGMRL
jgi:RimJ/RimL family protein N-acetyltransferase